MDLPEDAQIRVAPDARWWPTVAALACELAQQGRAAEARDLRRVLVIVPSLRQAPDLRAALRAALAGQACIAPRILTLEAWARFDPEQAVCQRAELFQALRESPWVREHFGSQSSALWALARDLALLSDELTLAAAGATEAFEGRWRAAVQRNFSQRAAAAAEPQAQLVLALWRAGLAAESGAAALRARLEELARSAAGPLVWLAPQGAAPWQQSFCRAYTAASGQPACLIVGDMRALVDDHPWLGAAWPELAFAADAPTPALAQTSVHELAPIAERARALTGKLAQRAPTPQRPPLRILRCESLEEEASAAAQWTVERLRAGTLSIALVALDRLTARRVRALLDRAGVLVADESGWKLSTTSAAAAVMRWLDLVVGDFATRDLLDWMHSPFTLRAVQEKAAIIGATQAALVEQRVVSGRQAILDALTRRARDAVAIGGATAAGGLLSAVQALDIIRDLLDLAQQWQRPGSLGRYLGLLDSSLDRLGMRPALAADPVGRAVLQAIERLRRHLIGSSLLLDPAEFRACLAEHFEQTAAGNLGVDGRDIDSPVVMTTLAATRLRRFDAALLVGVDADHLPGARSAGGLMAHSVRRDLGLRTDLDREREQLQDLAGLLASSGATDATWRCRRQDEPLPLSPLLDRLAMVAELAGTGSPVCVAAAARHVVAPQVSAVRAPSAPGLLPRRVSASAYQDLVDCPYRFFALRMLGLREAARLREKPDKRDFGSLMHAILFTFHRGQSPSAAESAPGTDDDVLAEQRRLYRVIDDAFAPLLRQQPALIAYRQRLRLLVPGYVTWQAHSRREGWRWQQGEIVLERPLGSGPTDPALDVVLHGRIDRIDRHIQGMWRVLDYKSRDSASLRRAQRDPGEDVQLLFYGLLLDPPPQEAAYLSLQRPPDPIHPCDDVVALVPAPQPLAQHAGELRGAMAEAFARIAGGAPLPANGAEAVCRRCELRSLCRHGFTQGAAAAPPAASADAS